MKNKMKIILLILIVIIFFLTFEVLAQNESYQVENWSVFKQKEFGTEKLGLIMINTDKIDKHALYFIKSFEGYKFIVLGMDYGADYLDKEKEYHEISYKFDNQPPVGTKWFNNTNSNHAILNSLFFVNNAEDNLKDFIAKLIIYRKVSFTYYNNYNKKNTVVFDFGSTP